MAKKRNIGRPKGPKKVAVNLSIREDRAARLKELADKEQKTQSILVENALESTYEI